MARIAIVSRAAIVLLGYQAGRRGDSDLEIAEIVARLAVARLGSALPPRLAEIDRRPIALPAEP